MSNENVRRAAEGLAAETDQDVDDVMDGFVGVFENKKDFAESLLSTGCITNPVWLAQFANRDVEDGEGWDDVAADVDIDALADALLDADSSEEGHGSYTEVLSEGVAFYFKTLTSGC